MGDRFSKSELGRLAEVVNEPPQAHEALVRLIPPEARPVVRDAMQARRDALRESEALNHAQEAEKLKREGVGEEHAQAMLERTASGDGSQSSFRALQLARVLMPQYRTPEMIVQFGSDPPACKAIAYEVWRVAFYTESTLEALARMSHDLAGCSPREAAQKIVEEKEAATRAQFDAEGRARQAARQKEADLAAEAKRQLDLEAGALGKPPLVLPAGV